MRRHRVELISHGRWRSTLCGQLIARAATAGDFAELLHQRILEPVA